MKFTPRLPEDNINVSKSNLFLETIKFLISGLILFFFSYFALFGLAQLIINNLDYEQEKSLLTFIDFDIEETKSDAKLSEILLSLKKCSNIKNNVQVKVLDDDFENAFALPGGTIIMTTKLIKNIKNDNELYFILGHELGHYKHKDHLKKFGNGIVMMFFSFFIPSEIDFLTNLTFSISRSNYSKEQEFNADEYSLQLMHCSLGHVNDATSFFERIQKNEKQWQFILGSHPNSLSRIENIKRLSKEKGYKVNF